MLAGLGCKTNTAAGQTLLPAATFGGRHKPASPGLLGGPTTGISCTSWASVVSVPFPNPLDSAPGTSCGYLQTSPDTPAACVTAGGSLYTRSSS